MWIFRNALICIWIHKDLQGSFGIARLPLLKPGSIGVRGWDMSCGSRGLESAFGVEPLAPLQAKQ